MRGEGRAKGVPSEEIVLRKDDRGRVLVDIRATVTRKLLSVVKKSGSRIVSISEKYQSLVAYTPLDQLEPIAKLREVRFISQPSEPMNN
jgi:hypothetical protein